MDSATSPINGSASRLRLVCRQAFDSAAPYTLTRGRPAPRFAYPSASPHHSSTDWWYRNINRLSIDYASRPRLRSRLTLGGRAFPRKPWTFGGGDSHSPFATHAGIRTRAASTTGFRRRFAGCSKLPYRSRRLDPCPERHRPSC